MRVVSVSSNPIDNPSKVAKDFCTKYDLDDSMHEQLVNIINSQLAKLLFGPIEEVENEVESSGITE